MIIIGSDHAGYDMKEFLKSDLEKRNLAYVDCGCDGSSIDYPDIAETVCRWVLKDPSNKGIIICGTGVGVSIAANKVKGISAALCCDYYSAKYTRLHNDSNVICLGGRTLGQDIALELLNVWLSTEFSGEKRHLARIEKINAIEERECNVENLQN